MAARTSSGIGVVVSLVIFIVISVVLLVLTIAFYSGQTREREAAADAVRTMNKYVTAQQRSTDWMRSMEAAAAAQNKSVGRHLQDNYEQLMGLVDGNPGSNTPQVQDKFRSLGVQEGQSIYSVMQASVNNLKNAESEMEALQQRVAERDNEISNLQAQLQQAQREREEQVAAVEQLYASSKQEIQDGLNQLSDLRASMDEAKDRVRDEFEGRVRDLEGQLDTAMRDNAVISSRVNELEKKINQSRVKPENPAMLVDGNIVEVAGANDQVYIDRGRTHRVALGMTFEVYDDISSIRPLPDGTLARGKASLEVTKVGDTTSTCKVTRATPGRPVLRNDVIANAVYDPQYQFKFLVHGKFDMNNDGRATDAEARHLESLVMEWGGTVVTGDQIPGDLDFLVLGVVPQEPPPLRADASEVEVDIWVRRRQEVETYQRLFRQASEAQIPVLNANRFFILIGHTAR
jgi:biopolymer transport protein ExbB/TolQ